MKLYTVVRSDISPGLQIAQAGHALVSFQSMFPDKYEKWRTESNNLVVLGVEGKEELAKVAYTLSCRGLDVATFQEPDLDNELTAITAEPSSKKYLSTLPLALQGL